MHLLNINCLTNVLLFDLDPAWKLFCSVGHKDNIARTCISFDVYPSMI